MGELAKANPLELEKLWTDAGIDCAFDWLRQPEIGTTMVRGRMGATGDSFNMGEMTITRCAVRLHNGQDGHGYVQGRSKTHARIAALCDALLQGENADQVRTHVLTPLAHAAATKRAKLQAKADATKVDFFTLVRGEANAT